MRQFLLPSKDTTIYQAYSSINTGLDEILEIGKVPDSTLVEPTYTASSARSLLDFDLSTATIDLASASYFLNLKLANAANVNRNQELIVYLASSSWDEGSGYFFQEENSGVGATWNTVDGFTSWSLAGGDFILGATSASIVLSAYPLGDIRADITSLIRPALIASQSFYGLAIQFPVADETSSLNKGIVKIFSSQTHTIHQPTLELAIDNQVFVTGSLVIAPSTSVKISPRNVKEEYAKGDVVRLDIVVRDEFPLRAYDSVLRYQGIYYLPSTTYYSITDVQANVVVVPFDAYSKINCDSAGVYVSLDTAPLYKGRFYTLKFRMDSGSYSRVIDTDIQFKVT